MRERRAAKKAELDSLLSLPTAEKRDLTEQESTQFDVLIEEIRKADERIDELETHEARSVAAAAARVEAGDVGEQRAAPAVVRDAPIYAQGKVETSYFRDLYQAKQGDYQAADRLRRNDRMREDALQQRALGNTGAAGGSGGEFAPPLWLIDEFVALARPGRKFADSLNPRPLPSGVASVNLPRVLTGTTTAIQTTQNTALSQTDMTTGSVSSGIVTIGGKQVVSLQLLQQSGIPFDEVILQDLAADYARQFSSQVLNGSNASGQLNGVYTYFNASGSANITYTQATPAVGGAGGLYSKIFAAAAAIESARYLPPDTIWMHPRRWNWILASSDANNRPLVNPTATGFNVVATNDMAMLAQGAVGKIGGMDVITDAAIPTNLGAGTNQDPVLVGVRGDLRVWESPLRADTFEQTYGDTAGVLFRVLAYAAAIPGRYTSSVAVINGTGLVTPAF
ncbi:MAG: phage major capsid protein [Blastococcus sp.]